MIKIKVKSKPMIPLIWITSEFEIFPQKK